MSVESDSKFFEIGRLLDDRFGGQIPAFVFDVDEANDCFLEQPYSYGSDLSKDDFERDDFDFEDLAAHGPSTEVSAVGVLSYDYEMDTVDTLHLADQINAYASDFWEFDSVVGDMIVFKRPKSMSSALSFAL